VRRLPLLIYWVKAWAKEGVTRAISGNLVYGGVDLLQRDRALQRVQLHMGHNGGYNLLGVTDNSVRPQPRTSFCS